MRKVGMGYSEIFALLTKAFHEIDVVVDAVMKLRDAYSSEGAVELNGEQRMNAQWNKIVLTISLQLKTILKLNIVASAGRKY